jgi:tetratricopeptide (TPR) repeat protein
VQKRCIFLALFLCILCLGPNGTPQKVTTKVSVYDDIFFSESGLIPLPENAIPLERAFVIQSKPFRFPIKMGGDLDGNIFASDRRNCAVYKFNRMGEFMTQIGGRGRKEGQFLAPYNLVVGRADLIIHDEKKRRLEYFNLLGSPIKSQKINDLEDFVIDGKNRVYAAHPVQDKGSPLVTVYSPDGKKAEFGEPLSFTHSLRVLNSRSLALNEDGDLFVAFKYFPIVRKYSNDEGLVAEYRIENPIMEAKENYNLQLIGKGVALKTQRVGYRAIIIDVEALGEKLYVLSHVPRLEISEMDGDGNITAIYWKDFQEVYETNDLLVQGVEGEIRFFVSHSFPPNYEIDVFRRKAAYSGGLKGEIERLTEEIKANPEYFTAFNNRGIARHRSGDYKGAIEDLTKAIELNPESSLAYNNRGLSRVKTKDLEGAVGDFTKAVELDPQNGSAFFNRGIALVYKGEFAQAIKDFEQASLLDKTLVSKAQEQIRYCIQQIKKDG